MQNLQNICARVVRMCCIKSYYGNEDAESNLLTKQPSKNHEVEVLELKRNGMFIYK